MHTEMKALHRNSPFLILESVREMSLRVFCVGIVFDSRAAVCNNQEEYNKVSMSRKKNNAIRVSFFQRAYPCTI